MRRTQIFKDSWAHRSTYSSGYRRQPYPDCVPVDARIHEVEDVAKLHADFWTMVGQEIKERWVIGLAVQ